MVSGGRFVTPPCEGLILWFPRAILVQAACVQLELVRGGNCSGVRVDF